MHLKNSTATKPYRKDEKLEEIEIRGEHDSDIVNSIVGVTSGNRSEVLNWIKDRSNILVGNWVKNRMDNGEGGRGDALPPHPAKGYQKKEGEEMRLWGILIFGLIGATATTFAVSFLCFLKVFLFYFVQFLLSLVLQFELG